MHNLKEYGWRHPVRRSSSNSGKGRSAIVKMPRGCGSKKSVGYKLFPFFGGDEVAPHEVKIEIVDLNEAEYRNLLSFKTRRGGGDKGNGMPIK